MKSIPIDIVNYICEFAAGNDKPWYPFFSPKTEKVSWKVNKYCTKYNQLSRGFLNPIREVNLTLHNVRTYEEREVQCKMLVFNLFETYMKKLYIEFDIDHDNNGFRAMLTTVNHNIVIYDDIYFNRTPYANINFGWAPNIWNRDTATMAIEYETY